MVPSGGDGRYQNLVSWGSCKLKGCIKRLLSSGTVTEVLEGEGFVIFAVDQGLGDDVIYIRGRELTDIPAPLLEQVHAVYPL